MRLLSSLVFDGLDSEADEEAALIYLARRAVCSIKDPLHRLDGQASNRYYFIRTDVRTSRNMAAPKLSRRDDF
jgi:hypothetical protein